MNRYEIHFLGGEAMRCATDQPVPATGFWPVYRIIMDRQNQPHRDGDYSQVNMANVTYYTPIGSNGG